jgi:hypothetical protein
VSSIFKIAIRQCKCGCKKRKGKRKKGGRKEDIRYFVLHPMSMDKKMPGLYLNWQRNKLGV